ncbi:ABC transporter ATPase [Sphingobacterium sp. JB170]|uniref:ABC transporter ATPase n=1 Tax=Sphingobacterium sp. JB170 TaxID=1434842 RepID=UPI00097E89F7|nr:ABC transporter ATPase [Sphingobacterium sp. JB170]SJN33317.1 hypothetical protein FM107_07725 [Sphingobacterium sp. JB170]
MKRVWIYQSSRFFNLSEKQRVEEILEGFVTQWTAHGNQLAGSFEIRDSLFIVLVVDETKAMVTGCSIDKSVHLLKQIEDELGLKLFDRLVVAYRDRAAQGDIKLVSRDAFQALIDSKEIDQDTIVFNNMITSVDELNENWEVPLKCSWHAKVFL